jgi:hypothetical protein
MISTPHSFIIREDSRKAAWQHGYRRELGEEGGWAGFGSTTAQGTIWLAAAAPEGPWHLAVDHPGLVRELGIPVAQIPGPGLARFEFPDLGTLYRILPRVYQLAVSLPDVPLHAFQQRIAGLPQTTEVERLVVQRIGQDIFRDSLLDYWSGRCPITGITDTALLRASHILPWSECVEDSQRLDVHNGLLLSALWDAAFDRALVTFDEAGAPLYSSSLSPWARSTLVCPQPLPLTDLHHSYLEHHRRRFHANAPSD